MTGSGPAAIAFCKLGEVALRDRERDVDRAQLVERHQRRRIAAPDRVAELEGDGAEPAVDRGPDGGVGQLDLGALDRGLVGLDRRLGGVDAGLGGVELLLGGEVLASERGQALELAPGVGELGAVALQGRQRLVERRLRLPAVEQEQDVAGLDVLAVVDGDLGDLAVDPRLDGDARDRLGLADGRDLDRHGPGHDLGREHRQSARLPPAGPGRLRVARGSGRPSVPEPHRRQQQAPESQQNAPAHARSSSPAEARRSRRLVSPPTRP